MEKISKLERPVGLASAFIILNVVDGLLTHILDGRGGYELNPPMRYVLEQQSMGLFWTVKIGAVMVCTWLLLLLANKYPGQIRMLFLVIVIGMTGVCVFNGIGLL